MLIESYLARRAIVRLVGRAPECETPLAMYFYKSLINCFAAAVIPVPAEALV